ncbi:hypothetical protein COV20_04255 [Candidatus Woesearchaeota archaeon CG10_big_fil_rev_8_21_14_0_10_45_16]|nr:MAG: hypothetical protein COV20_04255 [Candidatus Woesearchaeota archaeon CG10_big_fil_rev_8_21_14_0_10_45_16]
MDSKRGQQGAAAGAAVLLLIIAGLMVLFIILLPPQERAELLDQNYTSGTSSGTRSSTVDKSVEVLLETSPGRIDYLAQREIEHPLPVVNIFTTTESKILAEKSVVSVKRAVFTDQTSEFRFPVADLPNTDDVLLSFNVESLVGELFVTLNGQELFRGSATGGAVEPIRVPKNMLTEDNTVVFSVSSPGLAFWRTNEAILQNVKVVGDVQNLDAQVSRNVFLVSETEKDNLEKVTLKFQPDCQYGQVGLLTVTVNGNEIYKAIPDCGLETVPIEFSSEIVNKGENRITFRAESGTYLLSHVVAESKLREVDFPTFYFEISHEDYLDVTSDRRRVRLRLDFVDVTADKEADVLVNGHINQFDTKEVSYTMDISDDIVRGNNAIKIKPKRTMEVRELKIELLK